VSGFLDRHYRVATLSRTKTTFITNMLRTRKGQHFHWGAVDGRDHEALRAFVKDVGDRLGRIDVLVNNAGIAMEGILPTMRTRDIVEAVEVNLTAALVIAQACSRFMLRQGCG
jgi:3-oxoacyl-[acyl-carrier protein] reductase